MPAPTPAVFLRFDDWRELFDSGLLAKVWLPIFRRVTGTHENGLIYCALVPSAQIEERLKDHSWDLHVGNGYPGISQSGWGTKKKTEYDRLGFLGGVEPLVICREFHSGPESFREISEEFRLFHNLYQGKKREEYMKDDESGNPEVVAKVTADCVEIRAKEVRQFLAVKEMHLAIQLDINRFSETALADVGLNPDHEVHRSEDAAFHWGVRVCDFQPPYLTHGFLMGKKLLPPLPKAESGKWPFNERKETYPSFIIGRDAQGRDVEFTCEESKLKNNFGANSGAPHYLTPVHFRAEVLSRYYSHPERFSVGDGYLRAGGLWGLKMDNDHTDRVVVFLGDLGRDLPEGERAYWRSFNIAPDGSPLSATAFTRSIRGWFADPRRPDLAFKNLLPYFNEKWREKFGWDLFLPLAKDDQHHLTTARIPINNDQGEFDAQVQSLTKLIVDSLNEAEIEKDFTVPAGMKGIGKFGLFLASKNVPDADTIITFLKNLQALRSTGVAHRKGSNYAKIAAIFDLETKELKEVAAGLFHSAHIMLRTVGKTLLPDTDWGDELKL